MYDKRLKVYQWRHSLERKERRQPMERTDSASQDPASRLAALRMEHRDLDVAIDALRSVAAPDQLQLARLKKRKLRLKDEIAVLEDLRVPDIIA
jgi:hypothetical protein